MLSRETNISTLKYEANQKVNQVKTPLSSVNLAAICIQPLSLLWLPCAQLWHAYLRERQLAVRGLAVEDPAVSSLNNTYERALVSMHKMPRIWIEYLVSSHAPDHTSLQHCVKSSSIRRI